MSEYSFTNHDSSWEKDPSTVAWGGVTDPSLHNPEQFRYLVHAINPFAQMNALIITSYDAKDGITYDEAWGDQTISMYEQPERVADRVSLSMSLIDQDHTGTWGEAGLIVEAPEQNVVIASGSDVGTHNNNLDFLLSHQADKHGVMSGDNLLQQSATGVYNEVVAVANRDGSQLQLKGFFFKATESGEPYNEDLARRMQMHASRLGVPVVAVTEQGPYTQDEVKVDEYGTAVHFNGHRYILDGYSDDTSHFRVYDEKHAAHFAAPHEIEAVLGYAAQSGAMSDAQVADIAARYETANNERQSPKVAFEEDGTVKEIVFYEGYGEDEYKVSLGKSGHGYRTHLASQARAIQRSMLDRYHMSSGAYDNYTPLSPFDATRMVEQTCQSLDEDSAEKVKQWFAEVKETSERQWQHYLDYNQRSSYSSSYQLGNYAMGVAYEKPFVKPIVPAEQIIDTETKFTESSSLLKAMKKAFSKYPKQ